MKKFLLLTALFLCGVSMASTLEGRTDLDTSDLAKYVTVDISDLTPQGNMDFDLTFTLTDDGIAKINEMLGKSMTKNAPVMVCIKDKNGRSYGVGLYGSKSYPDKRWTSLSFVLRGDLEISGQVLPSYSREVYRTELNNKNQNEMVHPIIGEESTTLEQTLHEKLGSMTGASLTLSNRSGELKLNADVTYDKDKGKTYTFSTYKTPLLACTLTDFASLSINTDFIKLENVDLSTPSTVPEPATVTLSLLALAGLAKRRRRA